MAGEVDGEVGVEGARNGKTNARYHLRADTNSERLISF